MRTSDTGDVWWKSAVVYCADVQTFQDSDGDGHGDLRGLTDRIEYLDDLGVTVLWLMPFYPTAGRDDGYDITDFLGVDRRLGDLGDVVELIRTANARGIRVIVDFVMNHTSDRHPWFRSARRSTEDSYREYYVWSATKPRSSKAEVVFPDKEDSIWQLDERTGEYYLHHFYRTQPDLNVANPRVREEIARTLGFWLQMGVSGFRIDAVPFLFATDSYPGADPGSFDPFRYLGHVRGYVTRRRGDALLLGEVNLPYGGQKDYFGGDDGNGLNMQFDFNGMQALYLSLARGDAGPVAAALRERPGLDLQSQWANFVRNHDELTLDKLTTAERKEVFAAFGPEPGMQLYGRGLRRRLPTMLGGDARRIRCVYSLMFSLPGTPVLFYGEEIGMGENLDLEGRLAVRTPMQWTSGPNGGFSSAAARRLARPLTTGAYGPEHVNVADQRRDPDSMWSFIRTLVRRYRQMPELGWAEAEVLDHDTPAVLAHVARCDDWRMLAVHNLSGESVPVNLRLEDAEGLVLDDVLTDEEAMPVGPGGRVELVLEPYGFRWLRPVAPGEEPFA
ncbi:MAG TPA: alpha-amylase family protein [Phycicoccus sp.]|nr:alpha-amylase family protein [Phycicoccus sp.]